MELERLKKIASLFKVKGEVVDVTPYGNGLINSSYFIKTTSKYYLMQRINSSLFKDVDALMNNISLVTDFIHEKCPSRQCLHIIPTQDDKRYYKDGKDYFRVYHFIKNSYSIDKADTPEKFYLAAKSFGEFMMNLEDFDASQLVEIIPNFHNTVDRLRQFEEAVANDIKGRVSFVKDEIKFVRDRREYASRIINLLSSGAIPTRVTHNDTKLNNVLFDKESNDPIAVCDLDTIMPGTVLYDIGDSLRFGTNSTAEDDPNLDNVHFMPDYFEAYVKGYLEKYKPVKEEKDNIAFSAILLTYECGMRFLTDYLNGDTYFKCNRVNHNLDRARNQFKLIEEMEKALPEMQKIVNKY